MFIDLIKRVLASTGGIDKFMALIVVFLGAVECYSGYKALKAMRSIYGFLLGAIIGALIGSIIGTLSGSTALASGVGVGAAIILGVAAAVFAYVLYIPGVIAFVFITATAFGLVLCENIGKLNWLTIALCCIFGMGAVAGLFWRVRPVVITVTAMSGAILVMNATCVLMSLKPTDHSVTSIALFGILMCTGIACQFLTSTKNTPNIITVLKDRDEHDRISFSERKYPGMQRAYRNYCIICGHGLVNGTDSCPGCGYIINE